MKEKLKFLILGIFVLLIFGCTHHNIDINREEDNAAGKAFLNKFYENVANKKLNEIDGMVSDSLKQLAGPNGISKLVGFINKKVGNYKGYTIEDHYIRAV